MPPANASSRSRTAPASTSEAGFTWPHVSTVVYQHYLARFQWERSFLQVPSRIVRLWRCLETALDKQNISPHNRGSHPAASAHTRRGTLAQNGIKWNKFPENRAQPRTNQPGLATNQVFHKRTELSQKRTTSVPKAFLTVPRAYRPTPLAAAPGPAARR